MKGVRAATGRSLAIVVSITALAVALGSGASASARSASQQRPASTTLTGHLLTLLHGWKSANFGNGTGSPKYAVSAGITYLYGSLFQPSGTNDEFAVLPAGARPAHILYIPIYVSEGAGGTLQVFPNGAMAVFSNNPVPARAFSSLAGISFPVGQ